MIGFSDAIVKSSFFRSRDIRSMFVNNGKNSASFRLLFKWLNIEWVIRCWFRSFASLRLIALAL